MVFKILTTGVLLKTSLFLQFFRLRFMGKVETEIRLVHSKSSSKMLIIMFS